MIAFVPKSRFLPMDSKPNYKTARLLAILEIEKAPGKEGRGLLT